MTQFLNNLFLYATLPCLLVSSVGLLETLKHDVTVSIVYNLLVSMCEQHKNKARDWAEEGRERERERERGGGEGEGGAQSAEASRF